MSETSITQERLRNLRAKSGKNQDTVAEACDISRIALARYESGQRMPKMNILAKLAEYYGVTVDYLMGRDETQADQHTIDMEDEQLQLFRSLYNKMDDDQRERAAEYMKFLISQKK